MTDPILRAATPADLPALEAIERAAFTTNRLSRRSLRHQIGSPMSTLLVADRGQGPAGYALVLYRTGSRSARLYSLAVAQGEAGKGLGRRLLEGALEAADRQGCDEMRLEVATTNTAALGLYRRTGFRTRVELPDYYDDGSAALRMARPIVLPDVTLAGAA